MSTNWKNKGWNNMQTMLDEAMPVRRRPIMLFPVSGKVASLIIVVAATAGSLLYYISNQNPTMQLSTFDFEKKAFSTSGLVVEQLPNDLKSSHISNSEHNNNERVPVGQLIQSRLTENAIINPASTGVTSNVINAHMQRVPDNSSLIESSEDLVRESEKDDDLNGTYEEVSVQQSVVTQEIEKPIFSDPVEIKEEVITENILDTENPAEETIKPAVNKSKYTGHIKANASVGNYSFDSPTLYGQLSLSYIHPWSESFSLGMSLGVGKGLLYQSTEVRLSEYNAESASNVNAAEAPEKDLSAYMDVKSISNVLAGIHSEIRLSRHWSVSLGLQAACLFNINHNAIQSTTLIPEGQSPQQIFTSEEIADRFNHWNNWDFRFNTAINYHMTERWSIELAYQQGFNSLLKYPLESNRNIQMQSITLGLGYKF